MIKIITIIIVGVSVLLGMGSRFVFKKSDNVVEEYAEKVIKEKTGYDVDLSPDNTDPDKEDNGKN